MFSADEEKNSDFIPLPYPEGPGQVPEEHFETMPMPVGPNQGEGDRPDDFIPLPMPVGPQQTKSGVKGSK